MRELFSDNFPSITSDSELQQIMSDHPRYDSYYIASACIPERRQRFLSLWQVYEPYANNHFLSELKLHFHSRTWEMYLGVTLIKNGIPISVLSDGPDIKIDSIPPIWIEAVAPSKGHGADAVPEMKYDGEYDLPQDLMLLRITNSLHEKAEAYRKYLSSGVIKHNEPYIIALNRAELDHIDPEVPLIWKALFALGNLTLTVSGNKRLPPFMSRREIIKKKNGEAISLKFFEDPINDGISAIIYSTKSVLNHPFTLGEDCSIIHNPRANNSIAKTIFSFLEQWTLIDGQIKRIN